MARKKHKDVEFMVEGPKGSGTEDAYYDTVEEASTAAVGRSISRGGEPVTLDVLVSSEKGAHWYGGDDSAEIYQEDPDASVHERIIVHAEAQGSVA